MAGNGNGKVFRTSNNDFTSDLYQALFPKACNGNLVFSPFGLHTVLGMVGIGARGETRAEIFAGLKLADGGNDVVGKIYHSVIKDIQKGTDCSDCSDTSDEDEEEEKPFTLFTANRVYSQVDCELSNEFANRLKNYFHAELDQLDLSTVGRCKTAATRINQWVASVTNNKIQNIISPYYLDRDTRLILINGMYFKGLWEDKFDPRATSKELFKLENAQEVYVDMMHIQRNFPYAKLPELNAEAVALPYKGGRVSMVIILPEALGGLNKLQSSIGTILEGGKGLIEKRLRPSKVDVSLPKFKIETAIENEYLQDILDEDLGIKYMFSPSDADFGGMSEDENPELFVSEVIQKAFIEVKEGGTEAVATVTSARMQPLTKGVRKPTPPPIRFVVDRPFYFQIVDHSKGDLVLFAGHCNDPTKRRNDE